MGNSIWDQYGKNSIWDPRLPTPVLSDCPFITTTQAPAPLFTTKSANLADIPQGVSNQTLVDFGLDDFSGLEISTESAPHPDSSVLTSTGGFIQNEFFEKNAKYLESENMRWSLKVPGAKSYEVTIIELELDQDCSDSVILWDAQQMTELLALRSCDPKVRKKMVVNILKESLLLLHTNSCLLYTSPSPRDGLLSRMPSSA